MKYPSITIFTGTYNPNLTLFRRVLESIKSQKYPGKIEHIVYDGGSTNTATKLAISYGCTVLNFEPSADEGSNRLYASLKKATGDLTVTVESDNILPDDHWLYDMVLPFQEPRVFSTYSAYNTFEKNLDILTKYFALLGSPDPTLYYLGKSDKIRMDKRRYDKGQIIKETSNHYVVRFTKETQPVMGDNGFMIRTAVMRKIVRKNRPFYHTDGYAELLDMGYDTVGVVKNSIIHVSRPNIIEQVKRRVDVKIHFTDEMKGQRKYLVYNPASEKDRKNLLKYIFFTLTLIQPLYVSIRGFIKIREAAWFLHPLMCLLMVFGYGYSEVRLKLLQFKRLFAKLL